LEKIEFQKSFKLTHYFRKKLIISIAEFGTNVKFS